MTKTEQPSAPSRMDATPRVDPERMASQPSVDDQRALRCGLGRYTVDFITGDESGVATIVSNGQLGSSPSTGRLDAPTAALVLVAAGFVRRVGVIDTPAWALA